MKQKARSSAAFMVSCVLAVSLSGCGSTNDSEHTPPNESIRQVQKMETSVPKTKENTLKSNVSIENVSVSEIMIYSNIVDEYDPEPGYVIRATMTNNNDVSCNITPEFVVDLTDTDNYGKERTQKVLINHTELFTPYGINPPSGSIESVGLAPHETKDIRYYINTSEEYLSARPLDYNYLDDNYMNGGYKSYNINSLANFELASYAVEESKLIYIPTDKWNQVATLSLDEQYDDVSSYAKGYPTYKSNISGSITNTTQDRWSTATAQFDVSLDGQTINPYGIRTTYAEFNYVDIGASVKLPEDYFLHTKNSHDVKIIPAILAYSPDLEYEPSLD